MNGHPLTDKQRRFFGAIASGGLTKELEDWLRKAQQLGLFSGGHKYVKREGGPGHYRYTYPEDVGASKLGGTFRGRAEPGAVPVQRFTIGGRGTRARVDMEMRAAVADDVGHLSYKVPDSAAVFWQTEVAELAEDPAGYGLDADEAHAYKVARAAYRGGRLYVPEKLEDLRTLSTLLNDQANLQDAVAEDQTRPGVVRVLARHPRDSLSTLSGRVNKVLYEREKRAKDMGPWAKLPSGARPTLEALAAQGKTRADLQNSGYVAARKQADLQKYGYQILTWFNPRSKDIQVEYRPWSEADQHLPAIVVNTRQAQEAIHYAIGAPIPTEQQEMFGRRPRPERKRAASKSRPVARGQDAKFVLPLG